MARAWTNEEDEIVIAGVEEGMTDAEIAKVLPNYRTSEAVKRRRLSVLKIYKRKKKNWKNLR